jgi:hypothetical protein
MNIFLGLFLPVTLAPQVTAWNLEETIWAVISNDFFVDASRAADLLTVFAVEEVLEGIEAVVCTRIAGVKGSLVGGLCLRCLWQVG